MTVPADSAAPLASMPPEDSVLGTERLQILCLLSGAHPDAERALCDAAAAEARGLTATPVAILQVGDPAVLTPGTATILLQATVDGDRLIATARRHQPGVAGELFGPPPVSVPLAGDLSTAVAQAVRTLLPPLIHG